jgi:hypothetical protein
VPQRQLQVFTIGCWAALATAAIQLAAHLAGAHPPTAAAPSWIVELLRANPLDLPGGARRTPLELLDGFSLATCALLATWGGVGLAVRTRGQADPALMYAVARTMAGGAIVLLVVSFRYWFVIPSMFALLLAVCFTLAAVRAPGH